MGTLPTGVAVGEHGKAAKSTPADVRIPKAPEVRGQRATAVLQTYPAEGVLPPGKDLWVPPGGPSWPSSLETDAIFG